MVGISVMIGIGVGRGLIVGDGGNVGFTSFGFSPG